MNLDNRKPVDFRSQEYAPMFRELQGNIVKGHGRDHAVSIFLELTEGAGLGPWLSRLAADCVTSAFDQLAQTEQYKQFGIPGALFGNLMLTRRGYEKLGFRDRLPAWFRDVPDVPPRSRVDVTFLGGMKAAAEALDDEPPDGSEPLETAYREETIDAMLLLADDSETFLLRTVRDLITTIEREGHARAVAVEIGSALRTDSLEGIEHFGYVDGRSQPLFLKSDFRDLAADGSIDPGVTTEKIDDKAWTRESGRLDTWNPFAPLSLVLREDPAVAGDAAFGSYYVFRKLEQDVMRFSICEQQLADALGLRGADRERAGAMMVGRFRDGTPLVLRETDGFIPAKANNFRYDELDQAGTRSRSEPTDRLGLKCPFQAHIRKVNPRQSVSTLAQTADEIRNAHADELSHRIVRRGITYGSRTRSPNAFQALDDLPSENVGLLFACFQRSIAHQFAFMQKRWANSILFRIPGGVFPTGLDPLIGQRRNRPRHEERWRKEYGGTPGNGEPEILENHALSTTHATPFRIERFVKFRGGEFFFAPSLRFFRELGAPRTV
jgi:Dyp-type peroxidase family